MDGITNDIGARVASTLRTSDSARASKFAETAARGKAEEAAAMFEELLGTLLVREMRRGLSEGLFGSGAGADVYEGWLDQHVGQSLADSGALDLARSIRMSLAQKQSSEPSEASE